MFKWPFKFRFLKKKDKKILDLSDIDVILTPKMTIDLTNDIDNIEINKDEELNTYVESKKAIMKIKEIDVEVIRINGMDVTDEIIEMAVKNKEQY